MEFHAGVPRNEGSEAQRETWRQDASNMTRDQTRTLCIARRQDDRTEAETSLKAWQVTRNNGGTTEQFESLQGNPDAGANTCDPRACTNVCAKSL